MKVYTNSEARQKFAAVLDVAGVKTKATTKDILDAVNESRIRESFEPELGEEQ